MKSVQIGLKQAVERRTDMRTLMSIVRYWMEPPRVKVWGSVEAPVQAQVTMFLRFNLEIGVLHGLG